MIVYVVNTGPARVRTAFSTIMPRAAASVKVGGTRDIKLIANQSKDLIVLSIDMAVISSGGNISVAMRDYIVQKLRSFESATLALSRVKLIMESFATEQAAAKERQRKRDEMLKKAEEAKAKVEAEAAAKKAAEEANAEAEAAAKTQDEPTVSQQVDAAADEIVAQLRADDVKKAPKKRASKKKSQE